MAVKFVIASLALAFILGLIYLMGMAIYNHFVNSTRRDSEELEYQANRLENLIRKAQK